LSHSGCGYGNFAASQKKINRIWIIITKLVYRERQEPPGGGGEGEFWGLTFVEPEDQVGFCGDPLTGFAGFKQSF
ncbi:hypothetical protein, partial [Klebsiella pneumoniae]